jgi:cell shape-determining protein MreC
METWIWITIAVIAALIVIAALAWLLTRQSHGSAHRRAESIRGDVRERASDFGERTAAVREREAEAQHTRAKADRLRAEAEGIEQDAHQRRSEVDAEREQYREDLRKADEIDPQTTPRRDS